MLREREREREGTGRIVAASYKPRTDAEMCVDAGVSSSACKVLVLAVCDVLMSSAVSEFLGKTKVYYVHKVALLSESH